MKKCQPHIPLSSLPLSSLCHANRLSNTETEAINLCTLTLETDSLWHRLLCHNMLLHKISYCIQGDQLYALWAYQLYIRMLHPKCERASAAEVTPNMRQYEREIGPKTRGRMGVLGAILGSDIYRDFQGSLREGKSLYNYVNPKCVVSLYRPQPTIIYINLGQPL
jgi:hypothetical protein